MPSLKSPKATPVSLNDLANRVKVHSRKTVERDLSHVFGADEGNVVFSWQEPDTATAYAMLEAAQKLKAKNALWPESLALHVAEMAVCHITPLSDGDSPGMFYAAIANKNPETFGAILSAFREAFPPLDLEAEIENAKND